MEEIAQSLREILPDSVEVSAANIAQLGGAAGAYALVITLEEPVSFSRKALGGAEFAGSLVYAGSANGPGGLQARLSRHFKRDKSIRWHVDELTTKTAELAGFAIAGGDECEIVSRLIKNGRYEPVLAGFGSSDCATCAAHLLRPIPAKRQIQPGGHRQA